LRIILDISESLSNYCGLFSIFPKYRSFPSKIEKAAALNPLAGDIDP